ncbi:M50 family metallopeptidase [Parenemella sanctibonifatiensis]|uniref:Peptidase n=1 Tax=Parenemella sanctibonifatiensis TaxID=2016505 RepID=A0A255EEF6_9ACTN|nr:site-2 protease family protein [Parenemella sanctibonifatiensis]OYN88247.1 peptidase [Parenemella sanctibonifatiensis]OYN89919.1 peptidase [Parenemella sanctibonifatiensis]
MTVVIFIGAAVLFFALVMASVALHEIGHLLPAKAFGVKVTQYFVGFGGTIKSWWRGETEYGFKWIPLGGYVRMVGMYPPDDKGHMRKSNSGIVQSLADSAREVEWEDIKPEDDGRLFYQKKTWQKLIIMAGGPMMNLFLAFVILLGVNLAFGSYRSQTTVQSVSECIVPQGRAEQTCLAGDPATPAAQMGIQPGDRIVAFNGIQIRDWEQMQSVIRDNRDAPATVVVERGGQQVTLPTVPTAITGVRDLWDPSKMVEAGFLGVSPTTELIRGGPITTANDMWDMTRSSVVALVSFPVKVYNTAADLVTGQPRDVYGPMSIVGASRTAGDVAVTDLLQTEEKVATLFRLLGSVNLFVALFNFVPLLPLDGGHIAGAIWEWLRRVGARLFGRPDPGYVDTAKLLPVAYVVGGFVAIAGAVLILADLISPIRLF